MNDDPQRGPILLVEDEPAVSCDERLATLAEVREILDRR
jgi:hypothetical protein